MCMNVSTSCKGTLTLKYSLGNTFTEGICPLHEPKSVLLTFLRGGGAFTLSLVDVGSVGGVVSVMLLVLLWV